MRRSRITALSAAVLVVALWIIPVTRAVSFNRWAKEYYDDSKSLNASTDLTYSVLILRSYAWALGTTIVFALLICWQRTLWLLLPGLLFVGSVLLVVVARPERPIVILPSLMPLHAAYISAFAVGLAFLISILSRIKSNARLTP
jgi:hypothetical protein